MIQVEVLHAHMTKSGETVFVTNREHDYIEMKEIGRGDWYPKSHFVSFPVKRTN